MSSRSPAPLPCSRCGSGAKMLRLSLADLRAAGYKNRSGRAARQGERANTMEEANGTSRCSVLPLDLASGPWSRPYTSMHKETVMTQPHDNSARDERELMQLVKD